MALEKIVGSETGASGNPDTTIAVFGNNTDTIYTCPDGRKFTGHVNLSSTTTGTWFKVNNISVYAVPSASSYIPVSLTAGSFVSCQNQAITLLGIESDA